MNIERYFLEALKPMKLQGSTGFNRRRQNLLADYDRANPNYPAELTALKKSESGNTVLKPESAKKIINIFKITDLSETNPRKLGNTGITISIKNGNYIISK
jgi:hypothetical protein